MHILIIEDEEQLCRSVAEGLRIDGYETDICFDGDEGLCLCMTENYDLILLDLNLPGTDGLEILRQFREHNTNTPVLILSARDQIEDKVNGLDLGANDYLTKTLSLPGAGSQDPKPYPAEICSGGCMPEMESAYL